MKNVCIRKKIFVYFILTAILLLIQNNNDAYGINYFERVCHINSDLLADTIVIDTNNNLSHIKWGSLLPPGFQVTYFVYSKDNMEKCKFSLIDFDEDDIKDMYINIKYSYYGIDSVFIGLDTTMTGVDSVFAVTDSAFTGIDSTYHYIIFGQDGIINIDTVYLNPDNVLPLAVESRTGRDEIFDDIALCTPGAMKVMTFKLIERIPPVIRPEETSVISKGSSNQFELFPVPSSDFLNFRLTDFEYGIYSLEIYNLFNMRIYQRDIQVTNQIFSGNVDLFGFASGIYSVRISDAETNLQKLIIIIK